MQQFFMKNISAIARCATLYSDAQLTEVGLNGYQAPYVPEICAAPGITQEQIAQRLHVSCKQKQQERGISGQYGLQRRQFQRRAKAASDHRQSDAFRCAHADFR